MNPYKKILCPVDLSENSQSAIALASTLAKANGATLAFLHVTPLWVAADGLSNSEYTEKIAEQDRQRFLELIPTDEQNEIEHLFLQGNPGPVIVRIANQFDLVVMGTHGRTGLKRLLAGSIAQYVMRNAECPVVLFRNEVVKGQKGVQTQPNAPYVTEVMRHVLPVKEFERMDDVLAELKKADQTAAPVIDDSGSCIGILTITDIERYRELKRRFQNRDETVLDDVFERDDFGIRRTNNHEFDWVKRHMSKPAITLGVDECCEKASDLFSTHRDINHLVIVDEKSRPVGITESADLVGYEFSDFS